MVGVLSDGPRETTRPNQPGGVKDRHGLTALFDLDLRGGGCVFLTSQELTPGPETPTAGSDGGSRASPPAFCFIHAPPVAILSRCIEPSLTDPLCRRRRRRANGSSSARSTLTAFGKTRPDGEAVIVFLHAGFIVWRNLHHPVCILIQESGTALLFFSPSYGLM